MFKCLYTVVNAGETTHTLRCVKQSFTSFQDKMLTMRGKTPGGLSCNSLRYISRYDIGT